MAGTPAIWILGCVLLLILYSAGESSHECHRNLSSKMQMNKESLRLLNKLNDECQSNNSTSYLSEFLNKMTKVSPEILRTIIYCIERLFTENRMPTTEAKKDVTDSLRGLLASMSQRWTECVYKQTLSTAKLPKMTNTTKEIASYFLRMDKYLKTEENSHCAWASVIAEVQKALIFVSQQTDIITRDFGRPNP